MKGAKTMTPSKERALQALLSEKNHKEAAAAAGITYRTLTNYLRDPDFQAAYNAAFGLIISKATRKAQKSMECAVDVLREIAENKNENGATRVNAARSIIEYGLKLTEFSDILKFIEDRDNTNVLQFTSEAS